MCNAVSLRSFEGILPGPVALWGSKLVSILYTPSTSTVICKMLGTGSLSMLGRGD